MNIRFSHIALRCNNINTVAIFFTEVIGLEKGFRPYFIFPGYWLYSPENKQEAIIHILSKKAKFSIKTNNYNNLLDHIAFVRDDYPIFIKHINKLKINFYEKFIPNLNTKQVFLKGPENITVEVNFII
ncbi:hypothetical protein [Candidatus Vesicomyidisocius calyptogenae]|uniref:VOC domain-containing protein n=1 Tax=Vesicomyosocius okutanii subsp. Calyptogena okutanii (strain HA) TaxID=412965 RepID=A5CXC9_VESOH|nr:hypothetical protein [Candidatus Vesicomyosocius okutanii]BAF61406.1 conserved hypothetical protein [Candidatus Vesicomyosocius okutanii]